MIIGPAFKIIETIFELLTPFIMAKLIDEGIPYNNNSLIINYGIILCLFAIFGYTCAMICQYLAAITQEQYGCTMRHDLFAHIQALNVEQTKSIGTNSLITRLTNDIYQIQMAVAIFMRIAPRAPFLLIGSTVMTFLMSPKLSLIFLIIIPLIIMLFAFTMHHTIPIYQRIQTKIDHLGRLTNEGLSGARVIRAFSRQQDQGHIFEKEATDVNKLLLSASKFEAFLNPTTQLIINGAIVVVIYFGQFEVNLGTLSQGQMIAVINYITQISLALIILVNFVLTFARAYTAAKRIEKVFHLVPEKKIKHLSTVSGHKLGTMPALTLKHVSFTYPHAAVPILDDISFTIEKTQTIGIIGGTGSGKTTLIRLLGKLYQPSSGTILLHDTDITHYPDTLLHKQVQIVFQQATLFSGTIAENLRMGNKDATDAELWEALAIAQADEFVKTKPFGLATTIEQGGKNLSGGQRQRLSIARSLVVQPEILILDDTSSALDYVTDLHLRQAINLLPMTKIIVSQRIHAIKDCDSIILLDHGTMAGKGTHEQLLQTNNLYRQIAESQKILEVK